MDLIDFVRSAQGGRAVANMARTFNIAPEQADAVIQAVIPELSRRIERNTLSRGGLADLVNALGSGTHTRTLAKPDMFGNPAVEADGNAILGHILGTKDVSRKVAHQAAQTSGMGEGLIKMLLPYIAQMLMAALANKAQGGLGDILSKIPGMPGSTPSADQPQRPRPARSDTPIPMPDMQPADTGQAGRWPIDNSGSQSGGGFENQQPLPMPAGLPPESGSRTQNPYGDLSDILRGGGPKAGATVGGGGSLWTVIRNVIGGALGFSTGGGVMGWIFRMVILRYGWSIVRTIFGRLFMRR